MWHRLTQSEGPNYLLGALPNHDDALATCLSRLLAGDEVPSWAVCNCGPWCAQRASTALQRIGRTRKSRGVLGRLPSGFVGSSACALGGPPLRLTQVAWSCRARLHSHRASIGPRGRNCGMQRRQAKCLVSQETSSAVGKEQAASLTNKAARETLRSNPEFASHALLLSQAGPQAGREPCVVANGHTHVHGNHAHLLRGKLAQPLAPQGLVGFPPALVWP